MIFLQETMCSTASDALIDRIYDIYMHGWVSSSSTGLRGHSGGLITSWDNSKLTVLYQETNPNWIWIRCSLAGNNQIILNYVNIYVPHQCSSKLQLWEDMQKNIDSHDSEAFCFMRDFNCIRKESESSNCIYRNKDSTEINNFVS